MFPVHSRKNVWKLILRWVLLVGVTVFFLGYSTPPALDTSFSPAHPKEGPEVTTHSKTFQISEELYIGDQSRVPEFDVVVSRGILSRVFGDVITVDRLMWSQVARVELLLPPHSFSFHYVHRLVPPHSLDSPPHQGWDRTSVDHLQDVQDFFSFLRAPPATCQKMVVLGRGHNCDDLPVDIMDGSKVVCLDPPLELPPTSDPSSCLTLSFGIHVDATFDEAMSDMNCEVHMFDMLDYTPEKLLNKSSHAYFHKVGLAEDRRQRYYQNIQREIPVDNLVGILLNNTLVARPVHILKVDIEGDEWTAFEGFTKEPIMDAVGQIALEIHNEGLVNMPAKDHLAYVQRHYDILRALEGRGFRKVAYWDNTNSEVYRDMSGDHHFTCGEILYVNSKWYNPAFKENLKSLGFKFK